VRGADLAPAEEDAGLLDAGPDHERPVLSAEVIDLQEIHGGDLPELSRHARVEGLRHPAVLPLERDPLEDAPDPEDELRRVEGLRDDVPGPELERARPVGGAGIRGDEDDGDAGQRLVPPHPPHELQAADARHAEVHEEEVEGAAQRAAQAVLAVEGAVDGPPLALEDEPDAGDDLEIVVGDESLHASWSVRTATESLSALRPPGSRRRRTCPAYFSSSSRSSAAELTQYRRPVGSGPSSKT
jgi:hypothetical protein